MKKIAYQVLIDSLDITKEEAIDILVNREVDEEYANEPVVRIGQTEDGNRNSDVWEWPGDNVFMIDAAFDVIITEEKPELINAG